MRTFKNPVDVLFDELEASDPDHFAVKQYRKYKLAAGKTAKSILISCGARLAPFDMQELRELMADDEMELDTLETGRRRCSSSFGYGSHLQFRRGNHVFPALQPFVR